MTEFNWAATTPDQRRAHWVTALRSDRYQQTQGFLHTPNGFCCLGVLCDLADDTRWSGGSGIRDFQYAGQDWDTHPPDAIVEQVGLRSQDAMRLADLNDDGSSFADIASFIETFR